MIKIYSRFPPLHEQVKEVIKYLNEFYPIPDSDIEFRYEPFPYFYLEEEPVLGYCTAHGRWARVKIATRNKFIRSLAKTTAHEYMHCIQFIERGLSYNSRNKGKLEKEARKFAEDLLEKLWKERGLYCPSEL